MQRQLIVGWWVGLVGGGDDDGWVEVDRAPVWPSGLRLPSRPPLLVYLDLNHWIGLAKAATGHRDGVRHRSALEACRAARASGDAVFPLSGAHYMEMARIKDPAQRLDVAGVMEELSGFTTLMGRPVVMRLEMQAVLDSRFGPSGDPSGPVPLVGHGFGPAFGRDGTLQVRDRDGADLTASLGEKEKQALARANLVAQRAILAGPEDDQIGDLRARGWAPESASAVTERRAVQERELVEILDADPRWRRGRLWDVVAARESVIELFHLLDEELRLRGLNAGDVMADRQAAWDLVRSMPTSDVAVALKTQMHRNGQRAALWSVNDVYDMDALALAVPYCDVVVTEKHACSALILEGLPGRYGTTVLTDLAAFHRYLADRRDL
jgi:hypothetical protein